MATTAVSTRRQAAQHDLAARKQRSLWRDAVWRLFRNRAAIAGLAVIVFAAFVAIFAPIIAPYSPIQQNTPKQLMEPIWTRWFGSQFTDSGYLLGSDELGRDILTRLMYGTRVSLIVGFVPVAVIFVVGASIGTQPTPSAISAADSSAASSTGTSGTITPSAPAVASSAATRASPRWRKTL